MACTAYPPEVLTKVDAYKQKLNTSAAEWTVLGREDDARVLSALMWDWLDELKVNTSHTHTHPFSGPLSGTAQVSRYQKRKTSLDFTFLNICTRSFCVNCFYLRR